MNKKNIKIQIILNKYLWRKYQFNDAIIYFKGFCNDDKFNNLVRKIKENNSDIKLSSIISNLENNFSIIIKKKKDIYAFTDKIKSFPLLYYFDSLDFIIFENYDSIKHAKLNLVLDKKQIFYFSLSGYTFDNKTIYSNIKPIKGGTYIHFCNGKVYEKTYYSFNKKTVRNNLSLEHKLKKINKNIILKLIESCKNKQIAVPLSAGYDSRLIVSGLKKYGFKNIITFSYGRKNNKEVKIAQLIANYLKIPWFYIPFTNKKLREVKKSKQYIDYENYADNLTSIHFPQDFAAIQHLQENNIIDRDSIIVNGQSGDFISGNHLPNINYNNKKTIDNLILHYNYKHFNLWNKYYLKNKEILMSHILQLIEKKKNYYDKKNIHKFFEDLEFENRQCKYVINGQRLYEFFDYQWRLPLWDEEYIEFWSTVPLEEKLNQKLYKKTLHETNWSGVWNNIPINPKNSFTYDMVLIRYIFKALFFFFGKEKWHLFEKKYLNYFIDPLCGFANFDYFKMIKDKRVFRNSLSWETEKYLKQKEIDLNKFV